MCLQVVRLRVATTDTASDDTFGPRTSTPGRISCGESSFCMVSRTSMTTPLKVSVAGNRREQTCRGEESRNQHRSCESNMAVVLSTRSCVTPARRARQPGGEHVPGDLLWAEMWRSNRVLELKKFYVC